VEIFDHSVRQNRICGAELDRVPADLNRRESTGIALDASTCSTVISARW